MSLYQKHRPSTLDEMVGNELVIQGLISHFDQVPDRVSHAHIFYGDSGCGKTTLARAISKSILGATDLTIREINTADNRGIDTVREISDQMKFLPTMGKATIFVVDEAHGLTTDAKRALLKPLEEYPQHVYFFLCTTNLPMLLKGDEGKAIGTRCQQWQVLPLTPRNLFKLASRVAGAENEIVSDDVLMACAEAANGSPREVINKLEKIIPIKDAEQQLLILQSGISEDTPELRELCLALMHHQYSAGAKILAQMKGQDAETIRRGVTGWMSACLLKKFDEQTAAVLQAFSRNTYDNGFNTLVLSLSECCG